jgi:hypothetical protein
MFTDTAALKANLKARAFEAYVARYAPQWGKPPQADQPPVAAAPKEPAAAIAAATAPPQPGHDTEGTAHPVDRKWTFPSADSIPPVSIMNAEPKLPKAAELPEPKVDPAIEKTYGDHAAAKPDEPARLPPKRPQPEAAPGPEPR